MITAGARRLTTGVIPISDRPLYTSFAWAYDLVVPGAAALQPEEAARLLAGRRSVVDVGCGTGRHVEFLASQGFDVIGVDSSPAMLDVARTRTDAASFEIGDLFAWRPSSPVDAVLCRGVLNDLIQEMDRQRGLESLWEMLRPGGLLVFSVREVEKTRARYAREPVITRSEGGAFFRAEARFVGDIVVVDETVSSADARADYRFEMKPWTLTEVDERAAAAGFKRVERRIEGDRIVAACLR
jgi:SAM-dependent methyltransferase